MNALFVVYCKLNTRTYMYTQSHTVVQGGRWNPSLEFLICCSISKRFCLQWKAFDLFYKMRYKFMGGGAAGEPQRHQTWSPSWSPCWI